MAKNIAFLVGFGVLMLIMAILPNEVDAAAINGRFVDDNGHALENGIEAIAAAGITHGCNPPSNDMYCPDRPMIRAEAAAFVSRALDLPDTSTNFFVDDNGHVNEPAINKLAAAGITNGCNPPASTRYCPNRRLTRGEFAAFLSRAFDLPASNNNWFVDDDGNLFESAINRLAEAGIAFGCNPPTNDRFCPSDTLTRAQAAGFMRRALGLPIGGIPIPLSDWGPITCNKRETSCSLQATVGAGTTYLINEGLFHLVPFGPGEETAFTSGNTRFELILNGSPLTITELPLESDATSQTRMWAHTITFPSGSHTLVGQWRWENSVILKTTVAVTAG